MCVHRLYIFLHCGHTTHAPSPLRLCATAARAQQPSNAPHPSADHLKPQVHTQIQSPQSSLPSPPSTPTTTTPSPQRACPPTSHPYQTLALHTTCLPCQRHRAALLAALEDEAPGVRVEGWKWRVRYVPRGREDAYAESETETMGEVMGSWVKGWGGEQRKGKGRG